MNKNTDPLTVLIDKDMFNRLLDAASISDREVGGNLYEEAARHARRFNPHLQQEHAEEIRREKQAAHRTKQKVREWLKPSGQIATVRTMDGRTIPVRILGKVKGSFEHVRVKGFFPRDHRCDAPISSIETEHTYHVDSLKPQVDEALK